MSIEPGRREPKGRNDARLVFAGLVRRIGPGRWSVFQPAQLPLGACALAPGGKWEPTLASLGRALPGMVLSVRVTQQDPRLAAHADSAIILKTTYDESLKGLSPGQLP